MDDFLIKAKAVVIGHSIADALGVPVEFKSRAYLKRKPVTDMQGYGTYEVPKGSWSDDTSMSVCALDAIAQDGKINFDLTMINFCRWYYKDEFTPTGETFDVGNTCSYAIDNYYEKKTPSTKSGLTNERSNGNGSLMRIHPFALYLYNTNLPISAKIEIIEMASALTHAHERSKIACGIYSFILWELLKNPSKESVVNGLKLAREYYEKSAEISHYARLFNRIGNIYGEFSDPLCEDEIKSSGYVVDTIEACIWCLLETDNYDDCVLKAVNLGDDTDTVGAIAGGLAGALYGYDAIKEEWKNTLLKREYIENLCEKAFGGKNG